MISQKNSPIFHSTSSENMLYYMLCESPNAVVNQVRRELWESFAE